MDLQQELAIARGTLRPDEAQRELIRAEKTAKAIAGSRLSTDLRYWLHPKRPCWGEDECLDVLVTLELVEDREERGVHVTEFGELVLDILEVT